MDSPGSAPAAATDGSELDGELRDDGSGESGVLPALALTAASAHTDAHPTDAPAAADGAPAGADAPTSSSGDGAADGKLLHGGTSVLPAIVAKGVIAHSPAADGATPPPRGEQAVSIDAMMRVHVSELDFGDVLEDEPLPNPPLELEQALAPLRSHRSGRSSRVKTRHSSAAEQVRDLQARAWMASTGRTVRTQLSEDDQIMLWDCFQLMDADGSGTISTAELLTALRELGLELPRSELQQMVRAVDADGSGEVSFEEFVAAMSGPTSVAAVRHKPETVIPFSLLSSAYRRSGLLRTVMSDSALERRQLYLKSLRENERRSEKLAKIRRQHAEKRNAPERFPATHWSRERRRAQQQMRAAQREAAGGPGARPGGGGGAPSRSNTRAPAASPSGSSSLPPIMPTKQALSAKLTASALTFEPALHDVPISYGALPSPRELRERARLRVLRGQSPPRNSSPSGAGHGGRAGGAQERARSLRTAGHGAADGTAPWERPVKHYGGAAASSSPPVVSSVGTSNLPQLRSLHGP